MKELTIDDLELFKEMIQERIRVFKSNERMITRYKTKPYQEKKKSLFELLDRITDEIIHQKESDE